MRGRDEEDEEEEKQRRKPRRGDDTRKKGLNVKLSIAKKVRRHSSVLDEYSRGIATAAAAVASSNDKSITFIFERPINLSQFSYH